MQKGTKEFYEVREQFEKDINVMPFYVGAKAERENNDSRAFYTNDTINKLFIAYMTGYQNAKCIYQ